jgi:transposase-like protein
MTKRRTWTDEQKQAMVDEFNALPDRRGKMADFCEQKDISESQMYAWLNKFKLQQSRSRPKLVTPPPPPPPAPPSNVSPAASVGRAPVPMEVKLAAVARLDANEDIEAVARDNNRKPSTIKAWANEIRRTSEHREASAETRSEVMIVPARRSTVRQIHNMDGAIFINHAASELDKSGILPSQLPTRDLLWLLSRRRQIGEP